MGIVIDNKAILEKMQVSNLTEEEHIFLESNKTLVTYKKGETIFKQSAYASFAVFIINGISKIYVEGSGNKNILVKIVKSGEYLGISDLSNTHYNYSAIALKDTSVYLIKKEALNTLISSNSKFAKTFLDLQSSILSFIYKKLMIIGTKQMHGRLAESIMYIHSQEKEGEDVFLYMARRDLAELAGMSTESAIRLLTEFKNDGIIEIDGKNILINNIDLLKRLSKVG